MLVFLLISVHIIINYIICIFNFIAKTTSKKLIEKYGNSEFYFSNPLDFPDPVNSVELYEPFILGTIITPGKFISLELMLLNSYKIVIKSNNLNNR